MSGQPRKRSPWRLSLIVLVGVIGFYIYLARPAEPVNDLKVVGERAYLVLGRAGLVIVDVSQPETPEKIGAFDTAGHASGIAVSGQYAFVADGRAGLRIIDIADPSSPREISAYDTPGYAGDVDVVGSRAYLADGNSGLLIVDIGDENFPRLSGRLPIDGSARKVAVQDNYAYLADNKNQLLVVDISNPSRAEQIGFLDAGVEIQDLHVSGSRIYLAAGETGLIIVDINNPAEPAVLVTIDTPGNMKDVAVNLDTIAFLADGENGILVYDISELQAVEQVGKFSGFYNANQVDLAGGGVYVSDRDSALYVMDVELDLSLQRISSTEQQQGNSQAVDVNENYAFVANSDRGLQVIDISEPGEPVEAAGYDSPGAAHGVTVSGDFVYLADGASGLRVLTLEPGAGDALAVVENAVVASPGEAHQATVSAQTIYLADGSAGLQIISVVNPARPEILGSEDTPGNATGVAVSGEYAYIADGEAGLRIINVLDSTKPAEVGAYDTTGHASAVALKQISDPEPAVLAFLADGEAGLKVVDVTDPRAPIEIGAYTGYETVLDVKIDGEYAYLATGTWGLRAINISDPENLSEVGVYNTPGEASSLVVSGGNAFLADTTRGLRIVDISEPASPQEIGFYDVPRLVRNITVEGDYAYFTDLDPGFRIADVSEPRRLKQIGHYDQGGILEDIAIQDSVAYLADAVGLQAVNVEQANQAAKLGELTAAGRANSVFVVGNLAYFTDSVLGMYIADATDPENLIKLSEHKTAGAARDVYVLGNYAYIADGEAGLMIVNIADPYNPITASIIDQFQNANSVIVSGDYAYLADGPNGLWVIDVTKPVAPETVAYVDTPGTALDLEISGTYLFVADGEAGVQVVNILNPRSPSLVSSVELDGNSLNLDTEWQPGAGGSRGNFYIYVAKGDRGLEIITADKGAVAVAAGLFETPGTARLEQLLADQFPVIGSPGKVKSARTVWMLFIDVLLIGIGGFLIWLGFFAQFVLPLNSLGERRAAVNRLVRYVTGSHGPAIRIENGKLIQGLGEQKRMGPGVILLDTASAAVLRTKTAFKQAVGPGVVFTNGEEFVHQEAVDLHTQVRPLPPLGPLAGEDPFAPWNKRREEEGEYQARQSRRKETSGFTRDGVEIIPNILAVVKTANLPGQGSTRFGFNPHSVQLAVTREGVIPNELRNIPWHDVPALLGVDLWREYLGKFTLTELFTPSVDGANPGLPDGSRDQTSLASESETRLETILRMVYLRLTQPEVPELDDYGRETSRSQASREYQILHEMGVEIKDISIGGLRFPRTVESQLVQQWLSTWLERAIAEREVVENRRNLASELGRESALIDFADTVSQNISEAIMDDDGELLPYDSKSRPGLAASLEMLVSGTQQLIRRSTRLHHWLTNEEAELQKLLEWIRR